MAYINASEVAQIRAALKEKFGTKFKFSVRRRDSMAVNVTIVAGEVDLSDLWKGTVEGDYHYGNCGVNSFHITEENYGKHAKLFEEIDEIIRTASDRKWFDNSDSQTDYFHTAFYYDIAVGSWDKPYVLKEAKAKKAPKAKPAKKVVALKKVWIPVLDAKPTHAGTATLH